ncbi:ABC transporter ATP-binding protein [Niabella yanshanensis]|uniref:ABC transporter ATP-binding protein n=1 Tax=Niabella yanshanensis TaxID=577386 RepID=A0ABZ0WCY1_9BACT|nr:ABC transporter ATP-binding protein [Niabella yanshanensis]WQD40436.1 ABC transporter ATP-binding protein [Niabella yanshanensis]
MAIELKNFNPRDLIKNIRRSLLLLWETSNSLALLTFGLHIIQALLPVASLYFIKILIEGVTNKRDFSEIVPFIIYFLVSQLLLALAQQYANYIVTIYQLRVTDYLSRQVLEKAVSVDYGYYENPAYHDNLHLAQQQSLYRAGMLLTSFTAFITSGFALLFLLAFFISMQSFFALLFIMFSLPLATIKWYYGIAIMQQERKLTPLERESNYLHQILTGVSFAKEARMFGFGSFFISKFVNIRNFIRLQKQQLNKKLTNYSLIAETVEIIAMAIIFAMLARQTLAGAVSIGLFVVYIQGFQSLQNNSKNFLQSIVQIFQQRIFLQDLFLFLDIPASRQTSTLNPFPLTRSGLIINNLSFQYSPDSKQVLHNVSLQCKPGQIIAIVGQNGSGKSTLIKLLAKLYEASQGHILLDDTAIGDIPPQVYKDQTVFLFQDFEKYFFTIEENIVLGEPDKTKTTADLQSAAEAAGAESLIAKLPHGYKTRMGRIFDGSTQLSGGEWQKIALARVFYRDKAQLIVLDEPTSALDAPAEYEIFKQIKAIAKNKMVILITHRLYNLKIADHLYVMENGRIAEEGSFDELIEKNGVFAQLYNMQQL